MEIAFYILIALLVLYSILGLYDGVFLHLYQYRLYEQEESKIEHLTHTIRAILFPAILFFLFLKGSFYLGLALVALDVLVLVADAYLEGDSRKFMGGLPRWEYILHLFVNGFHFAAVAVFLAVKIRLDNSSIIIINDFSMVNSFYAFEWLVINLLPGAMVVATLHILLYFKSVTKYFNKLILPCCVPKNG